MMLKQIMHNLNWERSHTWAEWLLMARAQQPSLITTLFTLGFNKTRAGVLQRTHGVTLSKTCPGSDRNPTTLISGWKSHGRAKRRKISGAQITLYCRYTQIISFSLFQLLVKYIICNLIVFELLPLVFNVYSASGVSVFLPSWQTLLGCCCWPWAQC